MGTELVTSLVLALFGAFISHGVVLFSRQDQISFGGYGKMSHGFAHLRPGARAPKRHGKGGQKSIASFDCGHVKPIQGGFPCPVLFFGERDAL